MKEDKNIEKNKKMYMIIMIISIIVIICIGILLIRNIIVHSQRTKLEEEIKAEKDEYNSQINEYIGEEIKGNQVISMIEKITKMNEENADKENYFISIEVENIDEIDEEDKKELEKACQECSFINGKGENDKENVKTASIEMRNIRLKIHSAKQYKIEASYNNDIIYKIKITEL